MAVGFLETAGYGVALVAMDKACKGANIKILGIDTINPKDSSGFIPLSVQVKFEGEVSDVKVALEIAKEEAKKYNNDSEILTRIISSAADKVIDICKISKVKIND